MIKIKVQRYYSILFLLIIFAALLLLIAGGVYLLFFSKVDMSAKVRSDLFELIGLVAFVAIPFVFSMFFNKEKYLAQIVLSSDYVDLIYKVKGKIVEKKQLLKSDIIKFDTKITVNRYSRGKSSYTTAFYEFNIKTKNEEIFEVYSSQNMLSGCPYQLILDLIKYQNGIPNFSYKISGTDIYAKKDIAHYCQFGKRLSFVQNLKFGFSTMPKISKILLSFLLLFFIVDFGFIAYLSMPSGKLSNEEKLYMEHYNKAQDYRIKERNYNKAIEEQNEAEKYFSNTAETHLEKAYSYQKLKQYDKGIKEAKEGLKYINSKSIYRKYHNFKFIGKEDIALYSVLGEMYNETKDYKNMKDCYDYIAKHVVYKYTDAYFNRGMAEYYLLEFDAALSDFLHHKGIIEDYISEQAQSEYKDYYPRYDEKNLKNINLWIEATKKYGNLK